MKLAAVCIVLLCAAQAAASAASTETGVVQAGTAEIAYLECAPKDTDYCNAGGGAVYSIRVDRLGRRLLASPGSDPAWSPDGRHLAYSRGDGGIWIVRADGTGRQWLTAPSRRTRTIDLSPTWSPDGRRIAFSRNWNPPGDSARTELYVVQVRTRRLRLLTGTRKLREDGPAWSPDGRSIAFAGGRQGGAHARDDGIYVLDLASRRSTRLTSGVHRSPDWSPDGRTLVFASGYESGAIHVVNRNGTGMKMIVPVTKAVGSPSWSPDGSRIAYARAVGERRESHQVLIVRSSGKGSRLFLRGAWSPDWRPRPDAR